MVQVQARFTCCYRCFGPMRYMQQICTHLRASSLTAFVPFTAQGFNGTQAPECILKSILVVPCSFKRAKQPGKLTRLLSCTEEQLQTYQGVDLVTTHVVPSLTIDPNKEHNDHYSAYNKPGAVYFWLQVLFGTTSNIQSGGIYAACLWICACVSCYKLQTYSSLRAIIYV